MLTWSGLPVVHLRSTVFLEHPFFFAWAAEAVKASGQLRLPFGSAARTSPIASDDVAFVAAAIVADALPRRHAGKAYEITGAASQTMECIAKEYSDALGRPVRYVDVPLEEWIAEQLQPHNLPAHTAEHMRTMATPHAQNRYDRRTDTVAELTGQPPCTVAEWVAAHAQAFQS